MRTIKFRAWDYENNQMLDVQELNFEDCFYDGGMQIRTTMYNDYFDYREMPLMQYTGLHDENGKEIYEGDIVNMHYFFENYDSSSLGAYEDETEETGIIRINEYGVYLENKRGEIFYLVNYVQEPEEELKILGNIYENKELLHETDR